MTAPRWFDGDEQLLEELGQALAEEAPGPERTELLMTGYDIVMADTVEAALVHDSAVDEQAAVRSGAGGARLLAFEHDQLEIEFELVGGRIVGQLEPPSEGTIALDQPAADRASPLEVALDDLGGFQLELRHPGTFRLRFVGADGRSVATGWVDGPHQTLT